MKDKYSDEEIETVRKKLDAETMESTMLIEKINRLTSVVHSLQPFLVSTQYQIGLSFLKSCMSYVERYWKFLCNY